MSLNWRAHKQVGKSPLRSVCAALKKKVQWMFSFTAGVTPLVDHRAQSVAANDAKINE